MTNQFVSLPYWKVTKNIYYSLLFIFPMLFLYEIMCWIQFLDTSIIIRNGADVFLRQLIMDYGKYKFAQSKKAHTAKRKQKQTQVKEIKFRPNTEEADYQVKLKSLIKFLGGGDKAKITMRFRGREIAHQVIGRDLLDRVQKDLDEHGIVEQIPAFEGRQMVMVIAPKR